MDLLKTYTIAPEAVSIDKINGEIGASGCITDFANVAHDRNANALKVFGEAINDEPALDLIVSNHNPLELDAIKRELTQKQKRKNYGRKLHDLVSSQLRLARISVDATLAAHAAQRSAIYTNFTSLQNNIDSGNFISAYEDVNTLVAGNGMSTEQIIGYRFIVSFYLTSTGNYTDPLGNKVNGGQYDELKGKALDAQGFIIE